MRLAADRNLDLAHGSFLRARMAEAQGKLAEASTHYRRALAARPVFARGWRHFGDVLTQRGDLAAAANAYQQAIHQQPDNLPARQGMAHVRALQGEHEKALEQLRQAVRYAPHHRELLREYADYEQRDGDPKRAVTLRQHLANINPDDLDNRQNLALLLAGLGQKNEAIDVANQIIASHGRTRQHISTLALVYRKLGEVKQGEQVLLDHLQTLGSKAEAEDYAMLARYRLASGQLEQSLAAYREARQHEDQQRKPITRELANLLFQRGAYEPAAVLFEQLHHAQPDDVQTTYLYGETLVRAANWMKRSRWSTSWTKVDRLLRCVACSPAAGVISTKGWRC